MCIELKDWILFVAGIVIGFFFSIAAYWLPLGQFMNECKALWNLRITYRREDQITIRPGVDMSSLDPSAPKLSTTNNFEMKVANDEGVGWHHTSQGWVRARILHVYRAGTGKIEPLYKVCHLDLA